MGNETNRIESKLEKTVKEFAEENNLLVRKSEEAINLYKRCFLGFGKNRIASIQLVKNNRAIVSLSCLDYKNFGFVEEIIRIDGMEYCEYYDMSNYERFLCVKERNSPESEVEIIHISLKESIEKGDMEMKKKDGKQIMVRHLEEKTEIKKLTTLPISDNKKIRLMEGSIIKYCKKNNLRLKSNDQEYSGWRTFILSGRKREKILTIRLPKRCLDEENKRAILGDYIPMIREEKDTNDKYQDLINDFSLFYRGRGIYEKCGEKNKLHRICFTIKGKKKFVLDIDKPF